MNYNCSHSMTHFLSHTLEGDVKSEKNCIYSADFQPMIDSCSGSGGGGGGSGGGDGEDNVCDETVQFGDKKRRLSTHQVKSLEKIFEVDKKLDPDRKEKVARDLGLQPRQVAIWFQNRRARWKTKQLQRDYNLLKSNYDVLKHNYHKVQQGKDSITKELLELKSKLYKETKEDNNEVEYKDNNLFLGCDPTNTNQTTLNYETTLKLLDLKDGLSDSDSSGVLSNDNRSQSVNIASLGVSSICSSSATELIDPYLVSNGEDESCNIFLVDQAPNFCWY